MTQVPGGKATVPGAMTALRAAWIAVASLVTPSHFTFAGRIIAPPLKVCVAVQVLACARLRDATEAPVVGAIVSVPSALLIDVTSADAEIWFSTNAVEAQALVLSPTGRVGQVMFCASATLATRLNSSARRRFMTLP